MEYKLYVGNLSYDATESEIRDLFAQAGGVKSVAMIKDKFSGQPKGFAFVEMESQAALQNAINTLNGKEFKGRPLTVNVARPREERGGFGGGGGGGRGGYSNDRRGKGGGNRRY